jgi:prepilin-type N-terminal cleavage/methylation domain-containing protein
VFPRRIEQLPSRSTHLSPDCGCAGYTLAEVLTAIGLAAILSGIALPNFFSLNTTYELTSATRTVGFAISHARMESVGQDVYCRVRFANATNGGQYWEERSSDGVNYSVEGVVSQLPSGFSFGLPEILPSFNPQGLGLGTSTITVANSSGQSKTITVNALGKVTVQ